MTINERVKYLRKNLLGLSMEEFGASLAISKAAISLIEKGENNVSDRTFYQICKEFRVSESWLRDGEGEPFLKMHDEDIIMEAVGRIMSEDSSRRRVIAFLSKLPPEKWEMLEALAHEMYEAIKKD